MSFHTVRNKIHPKTILYFLLPLICFYSLEFYTHDPWQMDFLPQLINYLLFLLAAVFLYNLTGHSACAIVFSAAYSLVTGIANYFVMAFRGNPILPWDLKSWKTALSVSNNYNYSINYRFVISTTLLILVLLWGLLVQSHLSCRLFSRTRLRGLALSALSWGLLACAMMHTAITDWVLTPTNLFTQWASYRDNGFTVTFIQNLQYVHIQKPEGYNPDTLEEELEAFLRQHGNSDSTVSTDPNQTTAPHILAIMNESFSDLSVLHDFETNEDALPYLHALQKQNAVNLVTGNLFVSVCGGSTANTEFEFLTGNSMAFLPDGSIPYQQYISGPLSSLASQLAENGYQTYGMHPFSATGWNRNKIYPWIGFEHTCFQYDFSSVRYIRNYISDESAFHKMTDLYENREKDQKLFCFEVTMQNHGGYSQIFENSPIRVRLKNIQTASSEATENYLTLVQDSDQALKELISYLKQIDEPVILVMFGDHQPNDYVSENIAALTGTAKENRSLKESQNRYIVPYVIWANYDLDKEAVGLSPLYQVSDQQPVNENTMSSNYLGACLTRLAGQKTTSYQDFLLILKKTLPVITANVVIDADGNYMTVKEAKKQYPELMNLYEKLQYYHLITKPDSQAES